MQQGAPACGRAHGLRRSLSPQLLGGTHQGYQGGWLGRRPGAALGGSYQGCEEGSMGQEAMRRGLERG